MSMRRKTGLKPWGYWPVAVDWLKTTADGDCSFLLDDWKNGRIEVYRWDAASATMLYVGKTTELRGAK